MKLFLALHIIFIITWFAGTFYLPRLFVYHAMTAEQVGKDRFSIMETKLFWFTTISVILATMMGLMLTTYRPEYFWRSGWFHVKLTLVCLLYLYHVYCYRLIQDFKSDKQPRSHIWYRWFNEVPVLPLFIIVFLVIYQPMF